MAEDAEARSEEGGNERSDTPPKKSEVRGQKKRTQEYRDKLYDRLCEDPGRALRRRRKETIEPAFGVVKEQMGFRRFHLRGKQKVDQEWRLALFAFNLRKLNRNPVWIANFSKN